MEEDSTAWPAKKQIIIEATIATIAREGFDRATTARIARQAKVGEGTIYRYFSTKEDLVNTAAFYTSDLIFGPARENFNPELSAYDQFIRFAEDFLQTGMSLQLHYQFMEQYLNTPLGIAYRKKILAKVLNDPEIKPLFYPLNRIIHSGIKQKAVKDLPFQLLVSMTMGPMTFILKHSAQGFMELDKKLISRIAESCWDAIRSDRD